MSDQEVLNLYYNTKDIKGKTFKTIKNKNIELYNYLINRYSDCIGNECPTEIVYRIINNINIRPTCVICGNPLSFSKSKGRYDKNFCSKECEHTKDGLSIIKKKVLNIKYQKYGNKFYNNRDKYKQTCLEKFGVTNPNKCLEIIEKAKITRNNTKLERYGDINYNNSEKMKQTKLERYGTYYTNQEKMKQTCIERYGVDNPMKNEDIKKKAVNTCILQYGTNNPMKNEDIKKKSVNTCIERYGVDNPMKNEDIKKKSINTCMEKYGVDNPMKNEEIKQKSINTCLKKIWC